MAFRHFSSYVSLHFSLGLPHADHCHLLTIFDIENPKTDPKFLVYRRFRTFVSRCFPSGLAHVDQNCLLMSFAVDWRKTGLNCTRVSTLQLVRIQLFTFWQRRRLPLTNYIWHWKTGNWSKISRVSTLQEVLILLFSCWSCSAGPRLYSDDFGVGMYKNWTRNRAYLNGSVRTYPCFFPWSCSTGPSLFADDLLFGMYQSSNLIRPHFDASGRTYPLAFPSLGLPQQDQGC